MPKKVAEVCAAVLIKMILLGWIAEMGLVVLTPFRLIHPKIQQGFKNSWVNVYITN